MIADAVSAKHGLKSSAVPALDTLSLAWIDSPDRSAPPPSNLRIPEQPDQPAYIMFTSGSTGLPKGVVVPHRAVLRLVVNTDFISMSNRETFLQVSALGFDASTLEIWAPLLNGGTCVLHPEPGSITLEGIAEAIAEQRVSTLWLTSSLFNTFIAENPEALAPVRQLLTGGEALSVPHVRKALAALPETSLFNGYGPTENTTFSTTYRIPKTLPEETARIPIGYPINGTQCALVDENLNIVEDSEASGELIVFGEGLALGYLNNPERSRERFIELTLPNGINQIGYRTGDLVSRSAKGRYDYLGRMDKQVKIDGHRIEPGEIECHLNDLDAVKEARVVLRQGPHGQKRLAAYLVSPEDLEVQYIRATLRSKVPAFMIPHFMIQVPDLPKTRNGKLDESRLPDPYQDASPESSPQNETDTRQAVADSWFRILGRRVGVHENFMDAGGTSLEALKLAKELEKALGLELSATFVFEQPTIARQSTYFASNTNAQAAVESDQTQPNAEHCEFAIVGIACRYPGAKNLEEFWANLLAGKETVSFFSDEELSSEIPPEQKANPAYVKAKGIVEGFDEFDAAFFGIPPVEARVMDPQQRILLELSWHALEDAGIPPGDESYRTGVFAGMNWARYYQQYVLPDRELVEGYGALNCGLANEPDLLSTRISYKLNLKGPSINVFTACSTGLVAVAQACEAIENGQCEQAIAAGISISTPMKRGYLYQEGSMLSKDGHCRPFDENASGTTFNDGAAAIVIKRRDLAERDGDDIYAVIKGYAVNNDGEQKASFTAPSVSGQVAVYEAALKRAGVQPSSIGFIETHGTATPLGDPIEVLSLKRCYHDSGAPDELGKTCAIGSVKSNIGHAIHAAGLASLIKTAMAVKENKIPPTLFFQSPNPKLELEKTHFHVNTSVEGWRLPSPRRAAVTSLGVGGTNAHVILEEFRSELKTSIPERPIAENRLVPRYPILISAKTKAALERQVEGYRQYLNGKLFSLPDVCYTTLFGRKHFDHRFVAFGAGLEEAVTNLSAGKSSARGKVTPGQQRNIGFMFSGQGTQAHAMGMWLYGNSPAYRETFDQGCAIVQASTGVDVKGILLAEAADDAQINQTSFVQPALFLLEYGLARHLMTRGVHPEFMIGHSIGEFAAAALAGIFTFEDAVRLVARRGELMQSMPPGNMLVVRASAEEVEPWIGKKAELAAVNAPDMIVLSGTTEAIAEVSRQLTGKKIANTLLATSHAFHSSMMAPIVSDFEKLVAETERSAPGIPIFSTMTGERLTDTEAASPRYWSQQLRNPVRFSSAIQAASQNFDQAGRQISLVEVGPGNTLVSLVNFHGQPDRMRAYPALKNKGTEDTGLEDIDACIGQLWADGHTIDWAPLFSNLTLKKQRLPGYAFSKDRFWLGPETLEPAKAVSVNANLQTDSETPVTQDVSMDANQHSEKIRSDVLAIIEDVSGYDLGEEDPATHFSEVGLDSLLLTQVATALERKFKLGITFRSLVEEHTSLALVADFIASKVPPEASPQPVATSTNPSATAPLGSDLPVPEVGLEGSVPSANGSIQDIVNAQLQIMRLQLQALGGNASHSVSAGPTGGTSEGVTSPLAPQAAPASAVPTTVPANSDIPSTSAPASNAASHTPGTRITRERTNSELTSAQRDWVDRLMTRYQDKYAGSKTYTQKHRKHLADPRSVSGFNPAWKEIIFPIVTVKSKGSKLWDIDGNELIDTSNGFGPILFGHSPDFITNAAKTQIDLGIETGPQSPLAGEVADLFCEVTGNERCTFACTGSEANVGALRIARTVTGRTKVVAFEGSYHGIHDEVVMRAGKDHTALPAAPGIPREATSNMILLPWGDRDSLDRIRELGDELAAVLVEPVQSRKPQFHSQEYISELRKITEEKGVALILDEVVTGFRVGPGGIRKRFDIDADLMTYGKVIGGGYPIGIIAGKAKYLDAMDGGQWQYGDESIPEQGVTFFAGTFVRHPLSLAVAKAVLTKIKTDGAEFYPALEQKTSTMAKEAKAFIDQLKSDVSFEEFASLFYISVPQSAHWGHLLFLSMTLDGIHIQQYRPNFLTTAHSDEDVQRILGAFKSALANLIVHGLLVGDQVAAKKFLSGAIPPGAKLGKNEHGEPAYFIEDPNNKGAYMEVGRP